MKRFIALVAMTAASAGSAEAENESPGIALPGIYQPMQTASTASKKFCGRTVDLKTMQFGQLENMAPLHDRIAAARRFSGYRYGGAEHNGVHGSVLYGYDRSLGFVPLYWIAGNTKPEQC